MLTCRGVKVLKTSLRALSYFIVKGNLFTYHRSFLGTEF